MKKMCLKNEKLAKNSIFLRKNEKLKKKNEIFIGKILD